MGKKGCRHKSGKPGLKHIPDILLRLFVEPGNIILVVVNTGANGKRDPMVDMIASPWS